jgi:hypothetical protein
MVLADAVGLSDPEAVSGDEGGVGNCKGAGLTPRELEDEPEDVPPPVDGAGRLSGINKLPSAGGLGCGGGAIEDAGGAVVGNEMGAAVAG